MNVKYIKKDDSCFPKSLKILSDCPDVIFALGDISILNNFSLAIIGSRQCTPESRIVAENITKDLSKNNIVIVSGLAIGIDSIAHNSCIDVNGKTVAVLGGGILNPYPKSNVELFNRIIDNGGCIISEYFPYDKVTKITLHKRNRIISSLSNGVVIIQAREKSGSLVTAKYAQKQKKKIFVTPGALQDESFAGSNKLLTEGSNCVITASDILKHYNLVNLHTQKIKNQPIEIKKDLIGVYNVMKKERMHVDEISRLSGEPINKVLVKLSLLELDGKVVAIPGNFFIKK